MKLTAAQTITSLILACMVTACASKETVPPQAQAAPPTQPSRARLASVAQPKSSVEKGVLPGSLQDFEINVGDRVLFAYDKFNLDDGARSVLQKQAAWLTRYPGVTVMIQGNCDERGTREYNLALGARRAAAVKGYLTSLGVSSQRLETISYGKERPVCTESNEACWARNRRAVSALSNVNSSPTVAMGN